MSSEERINAGARSPGDPQAAVQPASVPGGTGAWQRPTVTRFGFDGTLFTSGSNADGQGGDLGGLAHAASAATGAAAANGG